MIHVSAEAIVKQQARLTLKNNWPAAIIVMVIALIPLVLNDCATTMLSCLIAMTVKDAQLSEVIVYSAGIPLELILGFLLSPSINGFVRAYYMCAKTGTMDPADAFYYFAKGRYAPALKLNLSLFFRLLIPAIIFFAPQTAFQILHETLWKDVFSDQTLYNILYFFITVLSSSAFILYSLRYFTIYAVSIDTEPSSNKEIFRTNRQIMNGRTGASAGLIASFIPWFILCLTVLPLIYVIPYLTQSLCISAKWIKEAYTAAYRDDAVLNQPQ